MQIGVLGSFEVRTGDGGVADVPGVRLRGLLAALALAPGKAVPKAALVDWIWGEQPPADAANALQRLVSRLRKVLPAGAILGRTDGYLLAVEPEAVDAVRFERLLGAGRAAAGDQPRRARLLREARALWRGAALADVGLRDSAAFDAAATRLETLRLAATEEWAEAETALGHATEVVAELTGLVAADPARERLAAALMRALAQAGRDNEALLVYERTRETLAGTLGADPSPELAALHVAVLRGELTRAPDRPLPAPGGHEARGTNLRAELTSYIGKDADIAAVRALVAEHRLTTVTGPGGAGKTRLATEAARTFVGELADGVRLVELAALGPDGEVAQATLAGLGLREALLGGTPHMELTDRLIAAIRERETLLVLDNCEHVIESAAAFAHRLLGECQGLRILATSREPLGITGEALWPVEPLALPARDAGPDEIAASPAVRLLRDRAGAVRRELAAGSDTDARTLATLARVCRALDGMPLAIELAAARLRTMSVDQLANRLDDRFRLLTGGSRTALPRHKTLRAAVDWSWELLSEAERAVLRRLAVFADGAALDAAEHVCADGPYGPGAAKETPRPAGVLAGQESLSGAGLSGPGPGGALPRAGGSYATCGPYGAEWATERPRVGDEFGIADASERTDAPALGAASSQVGAPDGGVGSYGADASAEHSGASEEFDDDAPSARTGVPEPRAASSQAGGSYEIGGSYVAETSAERYGGSGELGDCAPALRNGPPGPRAGSYGSGVAGAGVSRGRVWDVVSALVEKSLVVALGGEGDAPRYGMSGTIREYAAQRLAEAGEGDAARRAHLAYFTEFAERAEPHLRRAEQLTWLAALEVEHGNIGAALRGALAAGEADGATRLAAAAGWYWWLGGRRTEGLELLTAVARLPGEADDGVRAMVYMLVGTFVSSGRGDAHQAAEWIRGVHRLGGHAPSARRRYPLLALNEPLERMLREPEAYLSAFDAHLADEDPWVRAMARLHLGKSRVMLGHGGREADAHLAAALAEFRAVGERFGIALALTELADRVAVRGEFADACAYYEQAVAVTTEVGATEDVIRMLSRLAQLHRVRGDEPASAAALAEAERYARGVTWPDALAELALTKAMLARWNDEPEEAARQLARVGELLGNEAGVPTVRGAVSDLLGYLAADFGEARAHRAAARDAAVESGHPPMIAAVLIGLADLALRGAAYELAARLLAAGERVLGLRDLSHPDIARIEERVRDRLGDAGYAEAVGEGARDDWAELAAEALAL